MKPLIALLFITPAQAHEFPAALVEYTCSTETFYVTTPTDKCILEQYTWFAEASMSEHYKGAVWYGSRHNWRGEVVGIDFKKVLERVRYLK